MTQRTRIFIIALTFLALLAIAVVPFIQVGREADVPAENEAAPREVPLSPQGQSMVDCYDQVMAQRAASEAELKAKLDRCGTLLPPETNGNRAR